MLIFEQNFQKKHLHHNLIQNKINKKRVKTRPTPHFSKTPKPLSNFVREHICFVQIDKLTTQLSLIKESVLFFNRLSIGFNLTDVSLIVNSANEFTLQIVNIAFLIKQVFFLFAFDLNALKTAAC